MVLYGKDMAKGSNTKSSVKLKVKKDRSIEVFPTTLHLIVALVFSLVVLVTLLYFDWSQYKRESAEIEAAKSVKANYFSTGRIPILIEYESNIAHSKSLDSIIREPKGSDIIRTKLIRSSELALTSRLVEIYPKLTDEEKGFIRDSLSDWKISRLLGKLPVLDAQNLFSALYADMKELEVLEQAENTGSPGETISEESSAATDSEAPLESSAGTNVPTGGMTPASTETGEGVTPGEIQDMFGTTDNTTGTQGP